MQGLYNKRIINANLYLPLLLAVVSSCHLENPLEVVENVNLPHFPMLPHLTDHRHFLDSEITNNHMRYDL